LWPCKFAWSAASFSGQILVQLECDSPSVLHATGAALVYAALHHAGFQTHTTPVLMNAGERAELGSEKYIPLSPILEGTVILKPNPDYVELQE
jgi:hypothetical protein